MRKPEPRALRAPLKVGQRVAAAAVRRKPIAGLADLPPDPLTPPAADADPEKRFAHEDRELDAGYRQRAANERDRFKSATDASYYVVVAFETGAQCDKFLEYFGIGRGAGSLFVDGRPMADRLGIELPKADLKPVERSDTRLQALVRRPK